MPSSFRKFAKECRSNIKLTPNDEKPLELWIPEASTREITQEFKLEDCISPDTKETSQRLAFEEMQLMELSLVSSTLFPDINEISINGSIEI